MRWTIVSVIWRLIYLVTNKHSRLKTLEKLAAQQRIIARNKAEKIESDRLQAKTAALTDEELKAAYQLVQEELENQPIDPATSKLTTQEIIEKYQQLCRESS